MTKDFGNRVAAPRPNVVSMTSVASNENPKPVDVEEEFSKRIVKALDRSSRRQCSPSMRDVDFYADDLLSLEKEDAFGQRLGFALGRRGREAVIRLMDEYDCTDTEIRALHMVGSLRWDGQTLRFKHVFWLKLLGVVQMGCLSLGVLLLLLLIWVNEDAAWHVRLSLVIVMTVLMYCLTWVHRTFFVSFRALRRKASGGCDA